MGFVVDALLLLALQQLVHVALARLGSFSCATVVTWKLNSRFTFRSKGRGYSRYLLSQSTGLLINYSSFLLLVKFLGNGPIGLVTALAISSLMAMVFNFFAMKFWVYSQDKDTSEN